MKVSIFKDLTFATGVDHSYIPPVEYSPEIKDEETGDIISPEILASPEKGHPDCVACIEVDFDPNTQALEIQEDEGKYLVTVIEKIIEESQESKKSRITHLLITSEKYEEVDTEGVIFEKSDIGPMIVARFFGGDPNAEMAYLQRWNYLKDIERTEQEDVELELIKNGYVQKEAFKNFILSLK